MTTNAWKNYPACKILYYQTGWDKTLTNKHASKGLFSKLFTNSFKDFSHSDSEFFSIDSSLIIFFEVGDNEQKQTKHARIQEFSSGGVQVSLTKKALTTFFFFFFFFF